MSIAYAPLTRTRPPLGTAGGRIQDDGFARRQPALHFDLIEPFRAERRRGA